MSRPRVPEGQRCETCRFYMDRGEASYGQCERFPPQTFVDPRVGGAGVVCAFPEVRSHRWCGEWAKSEAS